MQTTNAIQPKTSLLALLPLFVVILLDVAGIILVMPVITPLILQTDSGMVAPGTSLLRRDFLYGLSLSLFPMFMFFSTPVLGDLSDKFGRKNILLLCLIGSAISYLVGAIGIMYKNLLVLLISRIIAGLAAGTQPIATAAIIDNSTPETKTKYLSWVVFTCSLGLILGPAVAGITAEKNIASWFGYDTPFFLAAIVSVLNAIGLFFSYPKDVSMKSGHKIKMMKGFTLFLEAFKGKKFFLLSLICFSCILAWSLYYQTINWFFMEKFNYGVGKLGLFVAYIGVIFAIVTSSLTRFILRCFANEINAFTFFVFTMAIANFAAAMSHNELSQWLWVILNAASDVVCYTVALSIYSNLASRESQGWIMGVTGSITAITWTVGGLIAGPLGYISIYTPLWTAGCLCFISFILILAYRHN